jgi:hypothetical protein
MKIRDLPCDTLKELLAVCAEHDLKCDDIVNFDIEQLELYIRAAVEDRDARYERRRKWCALMDESDSLINPIRARCPDLKFEELFRFLQGPDRVRADAIERELDEMARVPLVTRDRQKWHEAVENEILDQLPGGSTDVEKIATAVLSRDPAYPPGPVQQYVEHILKLPILLGFLKTGE